MGRRKVSSTKGGFGKGGQVGYTSERVINAVERGNCDVIQAINNCCCNTQKAIIEQGYC